MTARRFAAAVAAIGVVVTQAGAQATDSVPPMRHIPAIDYARIRPFHRMYDMLVQGKDSATIIGLRDVRFEETALADSSPGWLLVESRTGAVAGVDSLILAADLRPVRWHAIDGIATLDAAFSTDSVHGSIRVGGAVSRFSGAVPPDLILSTAFAEALASSLPLSAGWGDSVTVAHLGAAGAAVERSELSVASDTMAFTTAAPARPTWRLTMRSGANTWTFWFDQATLDLVQATQPLPSHIGGRLEYRARPAIAP